METDTCMTHIYSAYIDKKELRNPNDAISQPYKTYFRLTNSIRLSERALNLL